MKNNDTLTLVITRTDETLIAHCRAECSTTPDASSDRQKAPDQDHVLVFSCRQQ